MNKHYRNGIVIIILLIFLMSNTASAYYVPSQYKDEANTLKNDVQWYQFALKYQDQHWGFDILRQFAQNYTDSGRISELEIAMKKYINT